VGYFSEQEVADCPAEHPFLDVPLAVDGVVPFACEVLIDELRGVAVDALELPRPKPTLVRSSTALALRVRKDSFFLRTNIRQ